MAESEYGSEFDGSEFEYDPKRNLICGSECQAHGKGIGCRFWLSHDMGLNLDMNINVKTHLKS